MRDRDEIRPLTGLRGLLAWWVVAFHFVRALLPAGTLPRRFAACGHLAVDVFFALSGYVLAKRYLHDDLRDPERRRGFWARRFARVYPLYLVSLALGLLAGLPGTAHALATTGGAVCLALQLALLNAWFHGAMFAHNWAAWSLSVEVFFYALFPVLFVWLRAASRRGLLVVVAVACAATFAAPAAYTAIDPDHLGRGLALGDEKLWSWYLKFFPLPRLPELVAGAAVALLTASPAGARDGPRRRLLGTASGLALPAVAMSGIVPYAYLHSGVLLPLVLALLVGLDHDRRSWVAHPALVALGRASYATYILHVPLFWLVARADEGVWHRLSHVAGYAALLLLASLLAHARVEEPLRRWLTRRLTPSRSAGAPRVPGGAGVS